MRIATWNVNGIRARQEQFSAWMERDRPDIACLQEIKAGKDKVPLHLCDLEGYWCFWHGTGGYSGVSLHISKAAFPTEPVFSHPDFDFENRIVEARLDGLSVVSVYVPNGGKDFVAKIGFLKAMKRYAAEVHAEGRELVICGDINVARSDMDVHPRERRQVIGQLPEERRLVDDILAEGLVDVGRVLDPDNDGMFSWWAPWREMRARNIGWRLDHIFASTSLANRAISCPVLADVGTSDHAPVMATFS